MYKQLKEVISARMVFWLLTRMSMHIYLLQDLSSMAVPLGTVWFCLNMGYPKKFMVRTCVFPLKPLWYLPFSDNIIEEICWTLLNLGLALVWWFFTVARLLRTLPLSRSLFENGWGCDISNGQRRFWRGSSQRSRPVASGAVSRAMDSGWFTRYLSS